VRGNLEFRHQHFEDTIEVAEDLVVPDPNDSITKCREIIIALPISRVVGVLPAVDLDDETLLAAHEVGVIRSKRLLAGELQPAETAIAKRQPQDPFGPRAPPP
jgi:hypothetical protein